ncbi:radical SAM protein [bacterium]|nr:radical SAM protein [bacterium]
MKNILTKLVRDFLVGKKQKFVFSKTENQEFLNRELKLINLYIHIPFCKTLCPYCPYNRVKYEKKLIPDYFNALSKEIDLYFNKFGKIKIDSIYIGGGTPTNAIDELVTIIEKIKNLFDVVGDIAIETTVSDINDDNLSKLKKIGVNMLSVGVQSFNQKYIDFLGRKYSVSDINLAFEKIKKFNFETVNIDLIFLYPNQKKEELLSDLNSAKNLGVNQITTYPLFTFPYSTIGNYMKIKKIVMPKLLKRGVFYKTIYNYFKENQYKMVSVWSFKNSFIDQKYSSVTRDRYIGFGAGAGSRLNDIFYFNTFSIKDYVNTLLKKNRLPIAIDMKITPTLSKYYWFYWRLYETKILDSELNSFSDWKIRAILKMLIKLKLAKKESDYTVLTEKGSFWIHLAQNYFVLDYINRVWSVMKKEAFPEKIDI